jgi:hypothetical protein
MSVGFDSGFAVKLVAFPPRNEPFAFRQQLETVYQTQLHRTTTSTFVDIEGTVVWTQEYLRYRLSGCSHLQAVQNVLSQIDGAAGPPECGGNVPFPPRNEPFDFRSNSLESKYRDGLHRTPVLTFVDIEGDIVWTTEYLRYRVSGCDHTTATQLVLAQINGAAPSAGCAPPPTPTPTPTPTPPPGGSSFARNYIQAIFLGSGPLTPSDGAYNCPTAPGFWTGFPRGTVVTIRVSTTESLDKRQAIQNAAAQVSSATQGAIRTVFTLTDDSNPIPGTNEVTSTTHPSPSSQGCQSDNGCTIHTFASTGVLRSSRAVQPASQTANAYAHDIIGHGIMGMCHVDGNLIGGPGLSLMSGGPNVFSGQIALQLTSFDLAAAQAVYGSGLNPGATRADFTRVGLIDSSSSQTTTLFPPFNRLPR